MHSAIVERLRARIAVCRQHHLSCEGRYERGRAESSDRERESTLQLLHLVQQGQGARKAGKHPKAAAAGGPAAPAAAPPDYHQHLLSNGGINGEQPAGEQRASALLAVSHSARCRRGGAATRGGEEEPPLPPGLPRSRPSGEARRWGRGRGPGALRPEPFVRVSVAGRSVPAPRPPRWSTVGAGPAVAPRV